ncbi:pentapeptide repeat-containing protein [Fortiea sp. LEGE XX443]|uniref:pentapeptide repeat-containing protein n=1 Tax=Fortiea sp. LEGE XX443 TaxID=1828611 RepID=UPI00188219A8|nr:pentapeptide repeat-containing protein [Fortiea sp. LEGE XX443]MBE9004901.1 pentapeptide repeat-containing protein [Fortiea sp. LEGE XX443]
MANEFTNANLRGKDFRGKNLTGVDFSHANIRGANFSNAILVCANFTCTKAGLPIFQGIAYVILSLIVSLFAGLIAAYGGAIIGDLLSGNANISPAFGIISIFTLAIFLIIILWQGLGLLLATLAEVVAACSIILLALLPENEIGNASAVGAILAILALAGSIAGVVNMALAVAVARVMALPGIVNLTGVIAVLGGVLGALLGVRSQVTAYLMAGLVGLVAIAIGIYVGWQAITGNQKYLLIRSLAVSIVSQGGTSFRGANLTDANFTQANLKSVDFRQATLTHTCWLQTKNLAQARLEGTYLENPKLRQLVVTKEGREKNFDRLNLRELNLENANLQDASFIGTDLSEANLQNANLAGAKLCQAQLYQTILNQACLTGAYIQNWGISTDTKFEQIKCDYIYMQLPTKDDPDPCRKPDNRREIFQPGDFAEFIAPIIKTLNLYQTQNIDPRQVANKFKTLDLFHYEGIDPTAAAIAVTQLAENHPEAGLEIVALEGRGKDKIRLQAIVANDANRSELYQEYFKKYTEIQSLPYSDLQALLLGIKEKEDRIQSLEKLLENAIHQPKFYVETYQNQGEFFMSQNKGNVNISGAQGNISGIAAVGENSSMTGVAIGAISGNVTNTINQLPPSPEPEKPGIKELLTELQAAIEADKNLGDEDKAEALEQIQAIAEAGQKPEDGTMQKIAKTALKFLKGTIADLPTTEKLVETCGKLLPLITKFFGLP